MTGIELPYIVRKDEIRTDYYDRVGGRCWMALFERGKDNLLHLSIAYPHGFKSLLVNTEGIALETAEDHKKLLINLGYYDNSVNEGGG